MPELPRISVSVKAAVIRDGAILLLSYDDESGFHYNLPGGKARVGEDLRHAVTRKVALETGLQVVARRLLCVVEYVPESWQGEFGDVQKVQFNFLAEQVDDAEPRMEDPPDPIQVGFEWIPLERLGDVYLLPRINQPLLTALNGDLPDPFLDKW
ncbi:NUDIX hydrolase [Streptomyces sp. MUSC 125]|nr:NUDIX hydrolase [Streptomyces sp. MUSC 125]